MSESEMSSVSSRQTSLASRSSCLLVLRSHVAVGIAAGSARALLQHVISFGEGSRPPLRNEAAGVARGRSGFLEGAGRVW